MALQNPSQAPRIVPYLQPRLAADHLPNGRWAFRVTQTFDHPDAYLGGKHGALDLGNYECGDLMLASVAGRVVNKRDSYGANICEVVENSGALVGYGHLTRFLQSHGAYVSAGTPIGTVGNTGLGGTCHCHFYRRLSSGLLVDPWPLLAQNAKRREAKLNANGIHVRLGPGQIGGSLAKVFATTSGGRIRRASDGKDLGPLNAYRLAKAPVIGATHGVGSHPKSWARIWIGGGYRCVALPLTTYR